jgi:hypothetical protein
MEYTLGCDFLPLGLQEICLYFGPIHTTFTLDA